MYSTSVPAPVVKNHRDRQEDSAKWAQWKQQLTAYVAWVNSQLKKKSGAHLVEDLRHDVKDGVALADLVEVIAGEKLSEIYPAPATKDEMRHNIDQVLFFMSRNHIKMHHITTKDVVEGNLKAIMRLILALAAHYKPNSVRHSASTSHSVTGIAQGAAAALTEARRTATRSGRHRRRRTKEEGMYQSYPPPPNTSRYSTGKHHHAHQPDPSHVIYEEQQRAELEGASASNSPLSSQNTGPRASLYLSDPPSSMEGILSAGQGAMVTSCESDASQATDSNFMGIFESIKDTHQMLFKLHDLLLNGESDGGENKENIEAIEGLTLLEQISVLKGRLLHTEERLENQRCELSRAKTDCLELQGVKLGLEKRLEKREIEMAEVNSQIMNFELEHQQQTSKMESLKKQLEDRDQTLCDLKASLMKQIESRDGLINDLRREILLRDMQIEQVREQAGGLVADIQKVGQVGAQLEAKLSCQDERMTLLADHFTSDVSTSLKLSSEIESVKKSLRSLKDQTTRFPSLRSVFDRLEADIFHLLQKVSLNGSHPSTYTKNLSREKENSPVRSRQQLGRYKDGTSSPGKNFSGRNSNNFSPARGSPVRGSKSPSHRTHVPLKQDQVRSPKSQIPKAHTNTSSNQTTVIYFTRDSQKPFSAVIPKKLGEICLGDLKSVIENPHLYHYYFKALDPDYGTVKEEVLNNDDVLPGWEGKIVAWLEKEEITGY